MRRHNHWQWKHHERAATHDALRSS